MKIDRKGGKDEEKDCYNRFDVISDINI
jgi:hypothetical protein